MKARQGFVSNSSSSSFILSLHKLTGYQLSQLQKHSMDDEDDRWRIEVKDNTVTGSTSMDNFDMHEFMRDIGIDPDDAEWSD